MTIRIARKSIPELTKESQLVIDSFVPNIVICGESQCPEFKEGKLCCEDCPGDTRLECRYDLRKRIKSALMEQGCLAGLFEELEGIEYASMDEKLILRNEHLDLVFIIPTSIGPISELSSFWEDKIIRPKIRVLVPVEYHPFYGEGEGYMDSVYKELMSDYGHLYPFNVRDGTHPDPLTIASTLVEVYKRRKLLELTENIRQ